jgi:biopolymer transport protein TolQ
MLQGLIVLQLSGGGVRASVPALIAASGPFGKAVLFILLAMSVYAWAVIWNRWRVYNQAQQADKQFLMAFRGMPAGSDYRLLCQQFPNSVLARVALAGQRSWDRLAELGQPVAERHEATHRAMDRAALEETARLERHIGFLGTTGSVTPFIGLMGTVWGVMSAFLNIGAQGSASLVVVAPGIAEALIATVAGLAAAIPAVIGYNHFLGRLRDVNGATVQFASEFLDRRMEAPKS